LCLFCLLFSCLQGFIADVETQLDAGGLFGAYLEVISIGPITFHLSPSPVTMLELILFA